MGKNLMDTLIIEIEIRNKIVYKNLIKFLNKTFEIYFLLILHLKWKLLLLNNYFQCNVND